MRRLASLQAIEVLLRRFASANERGVGPNDIIAAIRSTLAELSAGARTVADKSDLAAMIEAVSSSPDGRREAALFIVRCLGVPD